MRGECGGGNMSPAEIPHTQKKKKLEALWATAPLLGGALLVREFRRVLWCCYSEVWF